MNRRVGGYPLQIPQLIDTHAQRDANLRIEARRLPPGIVLDEKIELGLHAQRAEHDFRSEAGVARIKGGSAREQQVGCVTASFYQQEYVERYGSNHRSGALPASTECTLPDCPDPEYSASLPGR